MNWNWKTIENKMGHLKQLKSKPNIRPLRYFYRISFHCRQGKAQMQFRFSKKEKVHISAKFGYFPGVVMSK